MIFAIREEDAGLRLDVAVAKLCDLSRSGAAKLIEEGNVLVNGAVAEKKTPVKSGDELEVQLPDAVPIEALPEDIPLNVVFEDRDLIVINKPSGMVVHPAPGNASGTLVNALLFHCGNELSGINGALRPGIVHRIDKDTSGLLVVAKNDASHRGLAAQLEGHHIVREYHAVVTGGFNADSGTVNAPIGRHPVDRKKMAVLRPGEGTAREAITHFEVLERYGQISYLKLILETGRTHQIRVHMSYTGHPLLGDTLYGGGKTVFEKRHPDLFDGQMLHAKRLSFTHPITGEAMTFECDLPENFEKALRFLRQQATD